MWSRPRIYYIIAILLSIPALLWNIQDGPFIGDESIRSLVALEMMIKGNYIVPSINGEFYFSKPPLYNWIIIVSNILFGGPGELSSRFPTIIFTLLFTYIVIYFHKDIYRIKYHNILVGLMLLTCGRIMFWDSFLALIDIFYSMLTYLMFVLVYKYGVKGKNYSFFLSAYGITAIGFLLKGYPSILFLMMTFVAYFFIYKNEWKRLLTMAHFLGILLFLTIVGSYFLAYDFYANAENTVGPLLDQATRRTILKYDFLEVVSHFFTYPFENVYHFLPWSLMIVLCFRKDFFAIIKEHSFVFYSFICLLANIWVYWLSPEVYPRYIIMLIPLSFTVFLYFYEKEKEQETWRVNILSKLFKIVIILLPIVVLSGFFVEEIQSIKYLDLKLLITTLFFVGVVFLYFKDQPNRPIILVISILILRIGFNAFVLPVRATEGRLAVCRNETIYIANKYTDKPLYILGKSKVHFINSYYLTQERNQINQRNYVLVNNAYYITDLKRYNIDTTKVIVLDSFNDAEHYQCRYIIEKK